MTKIKWGILSTAKIAETALIPAINKSKNSELISVASRNKNKANKFAKLHSIPNNHGSYKKLYNDPNIDVIYNPLPNHLHLKSTIEAAKAGKHVLLEKPITLRSKDVDKLIDISKKNKILISEAFMVRHHPQWIWIKQQIKKGFLGKVHSINSVFSYNNKDPKNIRNIKKYGGGAIYDIGCYPIQISRFILGKEPLQVMAISKFDKIFKTDFLSSAILDFGDIHSLFTVSTQSTMKQSVTILGDRKAIVVENPFNAIPSKTTTIIVYNNKSIYRNKNLIKVFPPSDQYENQVNDFSKKIIKKNKFIHNLEDAKKNMRVIDSIFLSNKFRKWTKV